MLWKMASKTYNPPNSHPYVKNFDLETNRSTLHFPKLCVAVSDDVCLLRDREDKLTKSKLVLLAVSGERELYSGCEDTALFCTAAALEENSMNNREGRFSPVTSDISSRILRAGFSGRLTVVAHVDVGKPSGKEAASRLREVFHGTCCERMEQDLPYSEGESEQEPLSSNQTESMANPVPSKTLLRYLYCSHFLSRWGNRMWEFAVGLFMIHVWPESLRLAAIYGLTETSSMASCGVFVGNWVDRSPRLKVVQISLTVQNSSIVVAGLSVVLLLGNYGSAGSKLFILLVVVVNLCGAAATLSGLATNIVVERDWVIIIAENIAPDMLGRINSVMRRIDLSCKLLAPVFVGALMSGVSPLWCAVMLSSWNAVSFGFEYWLLHQVYWSTAPLREQKLGTLPSSEISVSDTQSSNIEIQPLQGGSRSVSEDEDQFARGSGSSSVNTSLVKGTFLNGWKVYFQQGVVLPGIAMALLYFTVLSFGSLMTAVLNWRGVPAYVLGVGRGVGAFVGILATVVYPRMQSRLKTIRTGLWSIWIQWAFLSLSATSVLVHNNARSSAMLIGGVVMSRFGLWTFDLAVTQLMQESVLEHERGVVGGVQNSLQSMMHMLTFVTTIIISNPKKFWIPVIMSYSSVGVAAMLYAIYSWKARGHLFHFHPLFNKL